MGRHARQIEPTGPLPGGAQTANFRSLLPAINGMTLAAVATPDARTRISMQGCAVNSVGAGMSPRRDIALPRSRRPS